MQTSHRTPDYLLSVIMPVLNAAGPLEKAVESALGQGVAGLQLLIVDAGSTDSTAEIAERLSSRNPCIRVLTDTGATSLAEARDAGLAAAEGRYVAFLGARDTYEKEALATRLHYLEEHPEARLTHSRTRFVDGDGNDLGITLAVRKTMSFVDAFQPVHLNSVTMDRALLQALPHSSVDEDEDGWMLFARALRGGAVSHFVDHAGAVHLLDPTDASSREVAGSEQNTHRIINWLYNTTDDERVAPQYREGLCNPPIAAVRRYRDFAYFIRCLLSGELDACRSLMRSPGFVAFLNVLTPPGTVEALRMPFAQACLMNIDRAAATLGIAQKETILRDCLHLALDRTAPALFWLLAQHLSLPKRPEKRLLLLTSFRTEGDEEAVRNCAEILLENCGNLLIDSVHVLLEGPIANLERGLEACSVETLRGLLASKRLVIAPITQRPNYKQIFDYANAVGADIAAVANADILLPAQAARLIIDTRDTDDDSVYTLTRWNETVSGPCLQGWQSTPPWPQWSPQERSFHEKNYASFDCYVFNSGLEIPDSLESVLIGTFGCDTAIAAILKIAGIRVQNPCLTIKTLHRDEKQRDYGSDRSQRDLNNNAAAVEAELLHRHPDTIAALGGLNNLDTLSRNIAWFGSPANQSSRQGLFLALGPTPWKALETSPHPVPLDIVIERGDINSATDAIARIPQAIADSAPITWRLSGFPRATHICDVLVNNPRFEAIGYQLFRYHWQAMIHIDRADDEVRAAFFDLLEMVREILTGKRGA
jgi:teichuronic acid biosynthesis glycosyltransferase TuaG